jgi:sucrose synthase
MNAIRSKELLDFFTYLCREDRGFYLQNELVRTYVNYVSEGKGRKTPLLISLLEKIQELFTWDGTVFYFSRPKTGEQKFFMWASSKQTGEEIEPKQYLWYKDLYILGRGNRDIPLHIDFSLFRQSFGTVANTGEIGHGMRVLIRRLSDRISHSPSMWGKYLFNFLSSRAVGDTSLLINPHVLSDYEAFKKELSAAIGYLHLLGRGLPFSEIIGYLKKRGFEQGWGNSPEKVVENLELLQAVLSHPEEGAIETFFARIPIVRNIVIVSPHGWFGQENVLGKPDTGGQVIYILDQVRELEHALKGQFTASGVKDTPKIVVLTRLIPNAGNTTCDLREEKVHGTENGWILRVPFRDREGHVLQNWISRFHVWPYLDRFACEGVEELENAFPGGLELVIGNYADGNIVASRIAEAFDTTLCTIAHALEKTKYLRSELHWKRLENRYHFTIHFAADLLSMIRSDFIITSTRQEIAGTDESIGQYESYKTFTLPGYFQVVSGSNIRDVKYNINPPGVAEDRYFPYHETWRRDAQRSLYWEKRLFTDENPDVFGRLTEPEKCPMFAMSRLDMIKNISGLVEAFGKSPSLQEHANLIFAGGTNILDESSDEEERGEIKKIHRLVDDYHLEGKIRWHKSIDKRDTGEVYRVIADRRGVFVQPAFFEGFGLTILEAMRCGVPTFGTKFGGPSEIIIDGENGYLINPHDPENVSQILLDFIRNAKQDHELWVRISEAGIARVREHFTWPSYSEHCILMGKLYGFHRSTVSHSRGRIGKQYWDTLYHFLIKNRAGQMTKGGLNK